MDSGWSLVLQALVIAVSTVIVRVSAKRDKQDVKESNASKKDVLRLEGEVKSLRAEFDILKSAYFKQNPVIDHRGPMRG